MILAINWSNALIVTLIGFLLVFVVLILLVFIIAVFGKVMAPTVRVAKKTPATGSATDSHSNTTDEGEYDRHLSADESAAIAMAIYLAYNDVHDEESHVITIKKVERRYSPWSSKIYGINNLLR